MPNWKGIEDSSPCPERVWFSRSKDTDPWLPLRKCDCRTLNNSPGVEHVAIEGGRAVADLKANVIWYAFYNSPARDLQSGIWFEKSQRSGSDKGINLVPMTGMDEELVEGLYQKATRMASSLGGGLRSIINESVSIENDRYKVFLCQTANGLCLRKKSSSLSLEPQCDLQRGYGEFDVDGETEEMTLGPVRYAVFVVHGIGEALWSREDVKVPGLIAQIDHARISIHKKQFEQWKTACSKMKADKFPCSPPNRIEFIPVEWYDKIHSSSSMLKHSINSITLESISKLRVLANDVVSDVLMYMTPEYCDKVLNCVTDQICDLYTQFLKIHPTFLEDGGKCVLMGHSLGSVIAWDILSILKDNGKDRLSNGNASVDDPLNLVNDVMSAKQYRIPTADSTLHAGFQAHAHSKNTSNNINVGAWGPFLPQRMTKTIPFIPDFTFFLGSPLGLFLALRGAHPVFEKLRKVAEALLLEDGTDTKVTRIPSSPFNLPSGSIYNIFHPSDPVAYRIEPLLLSPDTPFANLPPPCFLVPDGGAVRLHVKAKEISDNLYKTFSGIFKAIPDKDFASVKKQICGHAPTYKFDLGGHSERVDFQLQTGVIESEYITAITAHNSYFSNNDIHEFIVHCMR